MESYRLSAIPLFSSLDPGEPERLLNEFNIRETRFTKGEILAFQGEVCNRLIILTSGSVSAQMSDPAGKVVKVEDVTAPDPLAILFLFGSNNKFPVQVTSNGNTTAVVIPKESVLKMLGANETLLKNYLDISAEFAGRLSRKLHLMSFRTIRQKLAIYLLELSETSGSSLLRLDRTKSSLAEYFGVSRPALEREISNMQNEGLISVSGRVISILCEKELFRMVNF